MVHMIYQCTELYWIVWEQYWLKPELQFNVFFLPTNLLGFLWIFWDSLGFSMVFSPAGRALQTEWQTEELAQLFFQLILVYIHIYIYTYIYIHIYIYTYIYIYIYIFMCIYIYMYIYVCNIWIQTVSSCFNPWFSGGLVPWCFGMPGFLLPEFPTQRTSGLKQQNRPHTHKRGYYNYVFTMYLLCMYNVYMYVHVCIYIYIYVHVCMYVYMYKYIYIYACMYIYIYIYICMYVYMYINIYVHVCMYVYVHKNICACMYVCMYIIYICACMYVCIYIYVHVCMYV